MANPAWPPSMRLVQPLRVYRERAQMMEPQHELGLTPVRRKAKRLTSMAVFALLDVNDRAIGRVKPADPSIWDTGLWPWIPAVERLTLEIRDELEAYLKIATLPHVAEVSGFAPDSDGARESVPVETGAWRTVVLFANGRWVDETASHFPVTRSCFERIHPKANVGFSALEAHSHIAAHVGANRGALRFQLPIIVPGRSGQCRIRIGDDMVHWEEGTGIVFDLSTDHEAWNETDDLRVLLMVEIPQPLPVPWRWLNHLAQYSYRWHPSYREMPDRISAFGRAVVDPATSVDRP